MGKTYELCRTEWEPNVINGHLERDKEYYILFDGKEYKLKCEETEGSLYLGWDYYSVPNDEYDFGICCDFTGTKLGCIFTTRSNVNKHTVAIFAEDVIVHKLDLKYLELPENLATTDDVQEVMDLAQTTADEKMSATNPIGIGSFSMGRQEGSIVGTYSHTEGYDNTASGEASHAEGKITTASAKYSHTEGWGTTASGTYSHAEGVGTKASGTSSHAEGSSTKASGGYSHAEGSDTTASGAYSHAEGASTKASGLEAHAEGYNTVASGNFTHTEGYCTNARRRSQHAQGEFNILDTKGSATVRGIYAHIIGNGTSDDARSNAHTLDWDGNAWYSGDVYVGSASGTNKDDGSKKLATEEYVDNAIAANRFVLIDKVTGIEYELSVVSGKLTMDVVSEV